MARKDDSIELPELSRENFQKLPSAACAAFAFRAVARVLPVLGGTERGLDFWPERDRGRHLAAVLAALDGAVIAGLGGRGSRFANVAARTAAAAAAAADAADARTAAYAARTAAYAAAAAYAAYAAARTAAYTYTYVYADARTAMTLDLAWLLENSGEDRGWGPRLAHAFLSRPLWEEPPPDAWRETYERWQKLMYEIGQSALVERYQGWLEGDIEPVEKIARRFNDWYERYHADESERPAPGDEPASKVALKGVGLGDVELKNAAPFKDSEAFGQGEAAEEGEAASDAEAAPAAESGADAPLNSGQLGEGVVTAAVDEPADVDSLGREPLVNTLADMLASPDQRLPLTIALLGDWGAGKSSVIEQLKKRLDDIEHSWQTVRQRDARIRYLHAEFNAWEYEQTDNIRAGLAQEVVNGLTSGLSRGEKIAFAFSNAWQQHRWEFGWSLFGMVIVAAALLTAGVSDLSALEGAAGSFIGVGGAAFLSFVLYNAWRTARTVLEHPLASQLRTYLKLPSYGKHLGLVPVIRQQIKALCRHRLEKGDNGRLLVVVDDLDRCSPECITETLDAVRLVMNLKRVAVIIAIDDRVAFQAVAKHYEQLGSESRPGSAIARDYLGKIIQLPINLPRPGPSDLKGFIRGTLFQDIVSPPLSTVTVEKLEPVLPDPSPGGEEGMAVGAEEEQPVASGSDGADEPAAGSKHDELVNNNNEPSRMAAIRASFEHSRKRMRDSADELDWFEQLAGTLGFSNPRQLIRLKNSYRLLKGVHHQREGGGDGRSACRAMMCALFWSEYLYQLPQPDPQEPNRQRHHLEIVMWDFLSTGSADCREAVALDMATLFEEVLKQMGEEAGGYFKLMRQVAMVVMPSAQGGVFLSQTALEHYVKGVESP